MGFESWTFLMKTTRSACLPKDHLWHKILYISSISSYIKKIPFFPYSLFTQKQYRRIQKKSKTSHTNSSIYNAIKVNNKSNTSISSIYLFFVWIHAKWRNEIWTWTFLIKTTRSARWPKDHSRYKILYISYISSYIKNKKNKKKVPLDLKIIHNINS